MTTTPLLHQAHQLRALSHPLRLRVAALLNSGDLRVCQLGAIFDLPFSTISTHLAALRRAGIVEEKREGRGVTYRLVRKPAIARCLRALWKDLDGDPVIERDRAKAQRALAVAPEDLCVANLDLSKATRAQCSRAQASRSAQ